MLLRSILIVRGKNPYPPRGMQRRCRRPGRDLRGRGEPPHSQAQQKSDTWRLRRTGRAD